MTMSRHLSVVTVGGGLAGLLAAIQLAQDGHIVRVFERRKTLSDRGGGILIRPNATRHLEEWGLRGKFAAKAQTSTKGVIRNLFTGEIVDERVIQTYSQYPNWGMTRQDVQRILFDEAQKTKGVSIQFDVDVIDVRRSPCVAILGTGGEVAADLVIVANGVHSKLRERVLGGVVPSIEPVVSGLTTYQTSLPLDVARSSPEIRDLVASDSTMCVWRDEGRHVVSGSGGEVYIADFVVNESDKDSGTDDGGSLWEEVGDISHVRRVYHDAAPPLRSWLSTVETCSRWKLCYLPDLPQWVDETGNVVLLGDAAHAMLPSAAQGLSQIIEDVAALSYLLRPKQNQIQPVESETATVKAATRMWQDFRMPRVKRIKALAGSTQSRYQSKSDRRSSDPKLETQSISAERAQEPHATLARPEANSNNGDEVRADMFADFTSPAFLKWQYDYDLVKELNEFVHQV